MEEMIALVGNPNAGKTTLFNRLTGRRERVGNWHGVTVRAAMGRSAAGTIVDLPGIYRLSGGSMEEGETARFLAEHPAAALVFVSEYATLPRTLALMREATRGGRRCLLVLTKEKSFFRAGGRVDLAGLGKTLGCLVISAAELNAARLEDLLKIAPVEVTASDMGAAYRPMSPKLGRFDGLLYSAAFGIPFFALLFLFAFFMTFARGMPGDLMKGAVEGLFAETLAGYAKKIPSSVLRSLACGLLSSVGGVLSFLPQIALLELFFILLEESGLFSRLAFLTDGILSRMGLSGRAVFSLCMGFGCSAAAILTTRGLDDREMQRRVITCLPFLPCSAKLPVFLVLTTTFFEDPFPAVLLLYALGVGLAVLYALFTGKRGAPLCMETAPLHIPAPLFVLKSLLFQIKQFIIKVATVVLAFSFVSWLLSSFTFAFVPCAVEDSMLAALCGRLSFLFAPVGMGDWRMTYAALAGLVAKENVAGAIALLYGSFPYSVQSAFAFAVFMLTCSPCVSAIAAEARELGTRRALANAGIRTLSALLLSYTVYGLLLLPWLWALLLPAGLLLFFHEKIFRKLRDLPSRLHRRDLSAGVDVSPRPSSPPRRARQRKEDGRGPSASPR